jgi:TRAP-type C4-dicarboxylate transport system substrate-binding protein
MMHNAAPVNPVIIDQNFYAGIVEQQHQYISGMITHASDTQKVELAKINQELIQTTLVMQFETNELEANQAEVADNIRKMEIRLDAQELELRVFKILGG